MKNIVLIISLFIAFLSSSQIITLYTEDFSNDWKKGAITYGGVTPSQPTDGNWSWVSVGSPDNDGGSASTWNDMAFIDGAAVMSTNGATSSTLAFRWNDVNNGSTSNRVDWYSKSITGAYTSITASLGYAIGNGSSGNSVWVYYQIDGGSWVLFGSSVNQSTASGTFTSATLSCSSSFRIKVEVLTRDYNSAYVTIDNVQITGCAVVVPSVSIVSSSNSICSGANVTFTATPTNGGSTPTYQWKKNNINVGTNSTTYSNSSLLNNDIITCVVTSNATCASPTTATSNSITMTINSVSVGGTVSSNQNIYSGNSPNDIFLTGNNGSVVKWVSSSDSLFTTTTDILITNTTLLSGNMGSINNTTYYRAIVKNGVCDQVNSSYVKISVTSSLPIELLYFNGDSFENHNHLTWSTASEHDNDYFDIEKTIDGVYFYVITTINGAGNSKIQLRYEYDDYDMYNGISYYRLKQIDYDGKFKYSNIISLDNSKKTRIVVRVINLYGTDVDIKTKGVLILIYDDGSIKKLFNE
jgi:hypothetical protein